MMWNFNRAGGFDYAWPSRWTLPARKVGKTRVVPAPKKEKRK